MKILTVLSFAFLAFASGCKSSAPNSPQDVTGDLKGTVGLYDSHGNEVPDRSGITIQAEGTSLSAISDNAGNWVIHNLPTQTYTITFSKTGYGSVKNTSFPFIGGGTVLYGNRVYLYQPVSMSIVLDSVSATGYLAGHISGTSLSDSTIIKAYVYFGTSPNIDISDTSTFLGGLIFQNPACAGLLTKKGSGLVFNSTNWESCGPQGWAQSGTTVYLQAFAKTSIYSPPYYDVATGKWIYPNPLPSSNVVSVTIP